jgi:uncharacterized protein (TIGR00369 family)
MNIHTHDRIDRGLCGTPVAVEEGASRVQMKTIPSMAVDATGLVHGGFLFGLADHAAMIAVNHPNVVLGAAEVRFLKPVKVGDAVQAEARVEEVSGKRHRVSVTVSRDGESVLTGTFACFVLDAHVLSP